MIIVIISYFKNFKQFEYHCKQANINHFVTINSFNMNSCLNLNLGKHFKHKEHY